MKLALDELKIDEQAYSIDGIELMISDDMLPFTGDKQIEYISSPARQNFAIMLARGRRC